MRYMGSKCRIAKYIVPIIQKYIDDNAIETYYDCFCGGANIVDKIKCKNKIASDVNPYLIALLQHVQQNLPLYETVDKELYDKTREAWKNNDTTEFEMWQLGCIGFLSSFNGKGFEGGYAKPGYEKGNGRYRDYYQEMKRNLLKQAPNLKDISFSCCDYRSYKLQNALIYCDPPYQNTTQYNSTTFNSEEFWQTMREWSRNNIVLISEQTAPDDFECIWEQEVSRSLNVINKTKVTEKLFKYKGECMKAYRVENQAEKHGIWRDFDGTINPVFSHLTQGKCKDLPMEDNAFYREDGLHWFSATDEPDKLKKWFSALDIAEMEKLGYKTYEFIISAKKHVYEYEIVFTRESIISQQEIDPATIWGKEYLDAKR